MQSYSLFIICGAIAAFISSQVEASPTQLVRASEAGARLNSDLLIGGGDDDTKAIQEILNRSAAGGALHLVIDGPALVRGLDVFGNTTIECVPGGGFFLKDGSNRSIIRNAHRSKAQIFDENITLVGCVLNGNRNKQQDARAREGSPVTGTSDPSGREVDGSFIAGVQFSGVNHLSIRDSEFRSILALNVMISNANYVDIRNVDIDHAEPEGPGVTARMLLNDGLHFAGPINFLTVDSVIVRSGDDAICLCADDLQNDPSGVPNYGPYVGHGPISNVTINNIALRDAFSGIRLLSANDRVENVLVSNVTGSVKFALLKVNHWIYDKARGNIGSVSLSNAYVSRIPVGETNDALKPFNEYTNFIHTGAVFEADGAGMPFILVDGRMDYLSLQEIYTTSNDKRPILQIGNTAEISSLRADIHVRDPEGIANVIDGYRGGHVRRFALELDWQRPAAQARRSPFTSSDLSIDTLINRETFTK